MTPEHFALHLAKYAGELAAACEKMGHSKERAEGVRQVRAWMRRRAPQVRRTLELIEACTLDDCTHQATSTNFDDDGPYWWCHDCETKCRRIDRAEAQELWPDEPAIWPRGGVSVAK